MNSLVAYGSSDDEDEVQPEKPSKIAKLEPGPVLETGKPKTESGLRGHTVSSKAETAAITETATEVTDEAPAVTTEPAANDGTSYSGPEHVTGPLAGPAALLSSAATVGPAAVTSSTPPLSPNTYERQRLRELTMPTVPNFDIPDSPPPPPTNSEEAAVLASRTKKFERFLELKGKGVHFNERLQGSSSLRNPSLLPKLMEFAGITTQDSYASSLPPGVAVPVEWPETCYVEGLIRQNERREKKRLAQRDRVDFVPASKSRGGEDASEHRKSRFDKG